MGPTPYRYLPVPAKCAIDYLDAQGFGHRSIAKLDAYLAHYFTVYGQACDEQTRFSCHHIAMRRFSLQGDDLAGCIATSPSPAAERPGAAPARSHDASGVGPDGTARIAYARITPRPKHGLDPMPQVWVTTDTGDELLLFSFDPNEVSLTPAQFKGLTLDEGRRLRLGVADAARPS